jgi:hypothetical protein
LTNGRDPEQSVGRLDYGDTASFSVVPGRWKITVKAFTKDNKENLVAEGTQEVDIKPGPNGDITIPMRRPGSETPSGEIIIPIMVTTGSDSDEGSLRWAIQTALESPRKSETIVIDKVNTITLDSVLSLSSTSGKKSVTIKAKNKVTIKRGSNYLYQLFNVGKDGTLILGGKDSAEITIDGGNYFVEAYAPLIDITGPGELIINDNVTLQNNYNIYGSNGGGGVVVSDNGTFTMNGGIISGNTASDDAGHGGGGVAVLASGTFIMNGGTISGNTAWHDSLNPLTTSSSGGGVYMVGDNNSVTTFTMTGGTISSNTADDIAGGGGVYVGKNTKFEMTGGTIGGTNVANIAHDGGGVYVDKDGTFNMSSSAIISYNTISASYALGGGVYVNGSFDMTGGTISYNKIDTNGYQNGGFGGGVYVDKDGTFNMSSGGKISYNEVTGGDGGFGGGVYVLGTFKMDGGEIERNTASISGGGVYVAYNTNLYAAGTFQISNGIVYGSDNTGKGNIVTDSSGFGAALYKNNSATKAEYYDGASTSWKDLPVKTGSTNVYYINDTIEVKNGILTPIP